MTRLSLLLVASMTLIGCASHRGPHPDDPFYAPLPPAPPATQFNLTGSIYQSGYQNELYSDLKAHRVGDVITVLLEEETKAKKSANKEVMKDSNMQLDPISAGGGPLTVNGKTLDLSYNEEYDISRGSEADQSNSLNGSITVNVLQVMHNGNLVIRGEKWLRINDGDEFIRITGIVRPRDINPDNTIDSFRVANARIQYSGTGDFAEVQKTGWLGRFFSSSWWPF